MAAPRPPPKRKLIATGATILADRRPVAPLANALPPAAGDPACGAKEDGGETPLPPDGPCSDPPEPEPPPPPGVNGSTDARRPYTRSCASRGASTGAAPRRRSARSSGLIGSTFSLVMAHLDEAAS